MSGALFNTVFWDILVSSYFCYFGSDGFSFVLANLIFPACSYVTVIKLFLFYAKSVCQCRVFKGINEKNQRLCIRVVFLGMRWIIVNLSNIT